MDAESMTQLNSASERYDLSQLYLFAGLAYILTEGHVNRQVLDI
jgi:hypothetical protein